MNTIVTGEWVRADGPKLKDRDVLGITTRGLYFEVRWNGYYWVDANIGRDDKKTKTPTGFNRHVHTIEYFLVHEKFNKNNII